MVKQTCIVILAILAIIAGIAFAPVLGAVAVGMWLAALIAALITGFIAALTKPSSSQKTASPSGAASPADTASKADP